MKGALTPLLGQAAVTCIPISGQDYSCKSKQLHPLQRGEDMESLLPRALPLSAVIEIKSPMAVALLM